MNTTARPTPRTRRETDMKARCSVVRCKRHPAHEIRKQLSCVGDGDCNVKCFRPTGSKKVHAAVRPDGPTTIYQNARCKRAPKTKEAK
jgi:hypothetical protein